MKLRRNQVRSLLLVLRETRDVEIDCEEFLALMAQYAECRVEGRPMEAGVLQKAQEHERLCASCREEFEALMVAMRGGRG
jgi:hypothetical protein